MRAFIIIIATVIGGPAAAYGVCSTEVEQFRTASLEVWDPNGEHSYALESGWSELQDEGDLDAKQKRQLISLLYADLNNVVKPKYSKSVSPQVLALLADAIRCVKGDVRSGERDKSKDSTKGLDPYFSKKVKDTFDVNIDLGEPL